jgi:hypothetical protein
MNYRSLLLYKILYLARCLHRVRGRVMSLRRDLTLLTVNRALLPCAPGSIHYIAYCCKMQHPLYISVKHLMISISYVQFSFFNFPPKSVQFLEPQ